MALTSPQMASIVIFCITSICMTLLIVKEIHDSKALQEKPARMLSAITLLVYTLYLLQILLAIPIACNTFGLPNGKLIACDYLSVIVMFLFFVAKGSYYTIFLVKLHIIFGDSTELRYSQTFLLSLSVFFIAWTTIIAVAFAYDMERFSYYHLDTQSCIYPPPLYLVLPTAVFDMMTTAVLLYLFIKKLRVLVTACLDGMHDHQLDFENTLQWVILKTTVLVCCSIFSTFFFSMVTPMVTQYTDVHGTVHIDLVINAVCVMLIKHKYNKQYKQLCRVCQSCVVCCCAKKMLASDAEHDGKQLQKRSTIASATELSATPYGSSREATPNID